MPDSQTYRGWKRVQLPSIADQLDAVLRPPADVPPTVVRSEADRRSRKEWRVRRLREVNAELARIRADGSSHAG